MEFVAEWELNPYEGVAHTGSTGEVILRANRPVLKEMLGIKEHCKFSDF